MVDLKCDMCGKSIQKYPSQVKRHNFCSRKCLADYSNAEKNPERYKNLKDYTNMSKHMSELNEQLNSGRMTFSTRARLSAIKRGTGEGKSYIKSFGRHLHRTVAERKLGRKLKPEEVVHHIDGNKRNNSPDNLKVFQNQAEHARWHAQQQGGDVR